jgi:hypothetical protein
LLDLGSALQRPDRDGRGVGDPTTSLLAHLVLGAVQFALPFPRLAQCLALTELASHHDYLRTVHDLCTIAIVAGACATALASAGARAAAPVTAGRRGPAQALATVARTPGRNPVVGGEGLR